jgi:hypothetical protein
MNSIGRSVFAVCFFLTLPLLARELRVKAPKSAIQQAEAYIDSLPAAQRPKDREDAIDGFLGSFFDGFIDTRSSMSGGTEENRRGFKAGQAYRRANPDKLKETMEGFGYTATEAQGVWTVHFEHSGFIPRDRPKETWWLSHLEGTDSNLPKTATIPKEGVSIRVTGFLSPDNGFGYGHMNQYKREFYATKISKLDGG